MFIVVIAGFVTCVDLLIQAFVPDLASSLGPDKSGRSPRSNAAAAWSGRRATRQTSWPPSHGFSSIRIGMAINMLLDRVNKEGGMRVIPLAPAAVKGSASYDVLMQGDLVSYAAEMAQGNRPEDRKSTRLNSSHSDRSRMPSSA